MSEQVEITDSESNLTEAEDDANWNTTLRIDSLDKKYQGDETVHAVKDVSFKIEEGEFVSIIGPSGSGKSTILRMIAGFEEPTEGEIILDMIDITDWEPFDRDVNMMFQDLALFPNYTVSQNIQYGPKQDGVPKEKREEMAEEMLEVVELSGYGERNIDELSGGEQQRVALARCMVNRPSVVLFDEPLASLDRQLRQHMTTELSDIQERTGSTFLYVTHDQEVALSASDRVIILNDGEIEQVGSPDELYNNPKTEFVATFVGDMNFFVSEVQNSTENNGAIRVDEEPLIVSSDEYPDISKTDRMKIGVRPHDVKIKTRIENVSDCYLPGVVESTLFKGDKDTVTVETDIGEFSAECNKGIKKGDSVFVEFSSSDIYIFPGE